MKQKERSKTIRQLAAGLLLCLFAVPAQAKEGFASKRFSGMTMEQLQKAAAKIPEEGGEILRNIERQKDGLVNVIAELENETDDYTSHGWRGSFYRKRDIPALKARLSDMNEDKETVRELGKTAANTVFGGIGTLFGAAADEVRADAERETRLGETVISEEGKTARLERVLNFFHEPRNIAYLVAGTAGVILSYYVIKHGVGITARYVESRLGKPKIIKETSRTSFLGRFWGKNKQASRLDEFVAAPYLKNELLNIADDTLKARVNKDPLTSILLYGPPGTGKTMFAKSLAVHSGLEWALIPGSSLSKLETKEALTKLQEIIEWARHSKHGTVLIFDEVENFLRNRGDGLMSEGSQKLITEFLAQVEKPSDDKVMFVMTTNRPRDLDPAALSRVGRCISVPVPEHEQLVELMNVYAPKIVQSNIAPEDGLENAFDALARKAKTAGLVGRDIEELFTSQVVKEVRRSDSNVLTRAIAEHTLDRFVSERKARETFLAA